MLEKYGNDVICIDETHGMNSYHFNLTTLLVLDDMREGFPCAFMISNRIDEGVLTIFYSKIKSLTGDLQPNVFMSDMAESFFNAWIVEMKPPKHRLYCSWHVDRAWRKNLVKIKSKDKQCETYKILRTLLQEQDTIAFEKMFEEAISRLSANDDTVDFANYFVGNYGTCVESWAYCHRLHFGINTNMHIERLHRTLKHIYLEGKKVKRLDKSLHALLKFIRDKSIDRLIVLHKGKITSKIKELRKRHKNSLTMPFNNVLENGKDCWNVMANGLDEMYTINKLKNFCDCQIVCGECQTCIHCLTCTCIDSAIKWNLCKHIHLVCQYEILKNKNINSNSNINIHVNNTRNETDSIVSQLNNKEIITEISDLQCEKQKFRQHFDTIFNNISSIEELNVLKKCLLSAESTLTAVKNNVNKTPLKKMSSKISPNNKKIIHQRRFFSTKKIRKNAITSTISEPNKTEKKNISVSLLLNANK